jgi:hypothetical protein
MGLYSALGNLTAASGLPAVSTEHFLEQVPLSAPLSIQVKSKTHAPQKLTGLISLYTNPVPLLI